MSSSLTSDYLPSLLVSYVKLEPFLKARGSALYRDWVLDSGAYAALTSGEVIDLQAYIAAAQQVAKGPKPPSVIFALDVIGDPVASLNNALAMQAAGLEIVPTFHFGSPFEHLEELNRRFDRIAIGGLVQRGAGGHGMRLHVKDRIEFLEQCYARIWPKWVHGFGCADERLVSRIPFCSVDSTTWFYGASRYGTLQSFPGARGPRSSNRDAFYAAIRTQKDYFRQLESATRARFSRTMRKAGLPELSIRLAMSGSEIRCFYPDMQ